MSVKEIDGWTVDTEKRSAVFESHGYRASMEIDGAEGPFAEIVVSCETDTTLAHGSATTVAIPIELMVTLIRGL